ncbi:MAG: hypothetical protein WBP64_14615 [Nitrososphaeraceae archaeon]
MSTSDGMMKILNIPVEKTNGNTTNLVHDSTLSQIALESIIRILINSEWSNDS